MRQQGWGIFGCRMEARSLVRRRRLTAAQEALRLERSSMFSRLQSVGQQARDAADAASPNDSLL